MGSKRSSSAPMLASRALARADIVDALADPKRIDLDRFLEAWWRG